MAERPLQHLLRHLRRVAAPAAGGVADIDLLGRFADRRDEAAFEALVWRHGPLIYGVCRRVLGHTQDAEDAFQAAFLILARKAGTVRRRAAVGPWIYRVAQRVAMRARGRVRVTAPLPETIAARPLPDPAEQGDLRRILDEEIGRLPARYRAAVVLRYLEGRTTAEAADALGCPPGTVLSRLASARRRLRSRLTARGVALSAALATIVGNEAAGAVPAQWVAAAVAGSGEFAAGGRTGRPAILAAEVLRAMLMTRLRIGTAVMFGFVAAGTGLLLPGMSPGRADPQDKAAPPPVEVTAVRPTRRTTSESLDFAGRADAATTVEVRSRVTSQIEKVAFQPGAKVKRGDVLFELDGRTYQIEYARAHGEVQRAESHLRHAKVDFDRLQQLRATGQISAADFDAAKAACDDADAGMMVAKAGLDRAKLDLDATRITSPIEGRTGGTVLGVGNLAAPTTTLVTIVATDPIRVDFSVSESELSPLQKLSESHAEVTIYFRDSSAARTGKIEFVDNRVDPKTGSVRVRAILPNGDGNILPGMYAQVRLPIGERRGELLVPAGAIRYMGPNQSFVLVPGREGTIEWRRVTIGQQPRGDGQTLISAGLMPNDRVIIDATLPAAAVEIRVREPNTSPSDPNAAPDSTVQPPPESRRRPAGPASGRMQDRAAPAPPPDGRSGSER
jgi:RND family efflux transporter MFP subunit